MPHLREFVMFGQRQKADDPAPAIAAITINGVAVAELTRAELDMLFSAAEVGLDKYPGDDTDIADALCGKLARIKVPV